MMSQPITLSQVIDSIELDFPFHSYKEYQECASILGWSSYQGDLNHSIVSVVENK